MSERTIPRYTVPLKQATSMLSSGASGRLAGALEEVSAEARDDSLTSQTLPGREQLKPLNFFYSVPLR
jgi:hypothetical protein